MGKSTATCWNPLAPEAGWQWTPVKGLEGMSEEITLSLDPDSEEYTQLTGHYASRPPGEVHGPFRTDVGCVVLEVSFPKRTSR